MTSVTQATLAPQDPVIARENLVSLGIRKPSQEQVQQELDRMHKANLHALNSLLLRLSLTALTLTILDTSRVNPILRHARAVLETRIL